MSGILNILIAGGSPVVNSWSAGVFRAVATPALATGAISINRAGTITYTNGSGASEWYTPSGGTPGDSYYVKFSLSGSAWDAGLVADTVYALSSGRSLSWSTTAGTKDATVTVSIYLDAGGTILLGTGTVTVHVEST